MDKGNYPEATSGGGNVRILTRRYEAGSV